MSKRGLVLVEGQTEERFVKNVLAPHFYPLNFFLSPTILTTKRVKDGPDFKGGVATFGKFENDLNLLIKSNEDAMITTMLDYYRLPTDFPGMESRPENGTPLQRVTHVEKCISEHFDSPRNLLIFLALHEFEALLFSSTEDLPVVMTEPDKQPEFAAVLEEFGNPEDINERPGNSPSKRIKKIFPAYSKVVNGPSTAQRIGLAKVREKCAHFNWWIEQLEAFAAS